MVLLRTSKTSSMCVVRIVSLILDGFRLLREMSVNRDEYFPTVIRGVIELLIGPEGTADMLVFCFGSGLGRSGGLILYVASSGTVVRTVALLFTFVSGPSCVATLSAALRSEPSL